MQVILVYLVLMSFISTLSFAITKAPEAPAKQAPEELTMSKALARAFQNNPTIVARRIQQELYNISYDEAWRQMYLPGVSLTFNTSSAYTLAQIPGSVNALDPRGKGYTYDHGSPASEVSLTMGQYTLYNFGKNQDRFDIAKLEIERSRQTIKEVERSVRFQVIQSVFNFKTRLDLLDASQRSVDAAQAIYELVRSRMPLGRATQSDLSSAEIDLLNAKNIHDQSKTAYTQALWELNLVLGDPIGYTYKVSIGIKYIKFLLSLEEALKHYKNNSPPLKEAKKALEQRRLEYKIAQKNALPLPIISFTGITFGYTFSPLLSTKVRDTTLNGGSANGNYNLSAGISFTIPILGDGGFLFGRALRAAELDVDLAELNLRNTVNQSEIQVRNLHTQILEQERTIQNTELIFKEASQVFDAVLTALQSQKPINRLEFKSAIEQLRAGELNLTAAILQHYNLKLQLANMLGIDRFPGESL